MARGRCCRTCVHWDKPADKRALSGSVYPCTAPLPEMKLPESITAAWNFDRAFSQRKYMERNEGTRCPAWADMLPEAPAAAVAGEEQVRAVSGEPAP